MKNPFTAHPGDTENPQGYWEHGKFALAASFKLQLGVIAGVIHAVFPWWFKFTTSTIVIKSFKSLVDSKRHKAELREEMPTGYIMRNHLTRNG